MKDPVLIELSQKYNKSVAQIILRYDVQNGIVTIPKSVRAERIRENADIFDFELLPQDIEKIDRLNRNLMHGDPDSVDF